MTKKVITPASGSAQTVYYENPDDNTVVKFSAGGRTITSHSKTDSFGRKVFDELQLGTGFVSRQFSYMLGEITDEHKENRKIKSTATTQLISHIALSDGRTISYEYDNEERITKVTDSVDGTTEYTYDALGQLLTETVDGTVVNSMEYDNYGNITKKNGKTYTYGNSKWKDLLTSYNGQSITYDAQGNPTSYLGHTLTWEKGRQLKKFDNIEYTYNANGIRTSKKVNGVLHTYTLDGTKILRETWGGNTLIPLYDNEDGVCGIIHNNIPYYFIKNLQGDVIAIVDKDAQTVARYSYDAWGVPEVKFDSSACQIATINPFRYRGYYYDEEIGLYYVSSRYYNPEIGRFLNSDDPMFLGISGSALSYNLWTYCYNSSANFADLTGTSPIQVVLAALFGVIGFAIADCIARGLGLFPSGKGFWNATMYWALTGAIAVGGAAIGWFAGAAITKIVVTYISKNPSIIIRIANECGGSLFTTIMCFLGINPFNYVSDASQLTALARALNSSWFVLPKAWAQAFCNLADKMGRKLFFDVPHGRYGYHIHLGGQNGQKLDGLHFQVVKSVWNFLKKLFEG